MSEYIRKADAVERMVDVIINEFDVGITYAYTLAEDGLNLPSADVAPVVHGRWIWKPTKQYCPPDCWYPPLSCNEETWDEKNGTWLEDEMYCSECDYHNYHEIKYNFCPNCGAIMDREE